MPAAHADDDSRQSDFLRGLLSQEEQLAGMLPLTDEDLSLDDFPNYPHLHELQGLCQLCVH